MSKSKKNVTKLLFSVIITTILLLAGSCQNWMSSDDFMSKIENEVHDANAAEVKVYVRYANSPAMGTTEPSGNTTMKVDVVSKVTAVTSDEYGFVKWAAFSTSDFATNKNHSNLTFISEEDYNNNIKDKELTSEDIVFSDPTEPVTEVKILKERNDIFLIPIVAARPTYVQSVPANADYNVVKNTSIRILFSKAIDKATLYDSEGKLNYSITSSAAVLVDDSQDIEAKDITDYFDATLSESGKMLTLKLKVDEKGEILRLLDNRARITITLFEGLCDRDGFSMSKNYSFNFQTGTNTDSLAPMIEVIFGGTGEKCDVFVSYHNVDENGETTINGKATDAAKKAPQDINSAEYTDALVAQRVYDKLNLFVKASDVIASGNADINPAKDLSEDNVAYVAIAASLYVDKDGNPVTIDETNSIAKQNFVYVSGSMDTTSEMTSLFNDVVPVDKDGNKYTGGSIYTYDVSSLPDGLIKLDLWGIDMTGNSGGPNDAGSPYYTKHDNGYKSIFIVKDTTAPDSATESKKIKSNSEIAPYYWYNNENLGTMQLYDLDGDQIVDRGHIKLRSLVQNLSWNFVVGKSTTAPASTDAGWQYIHDQTTGLSLKYSLKNAEPPKIDGPVDITLYIRDDLGNVSEPVLLNSIMYDNTKPTVTLKNAYGDFVTEAGVLAQHNSKPAVVSQILKVNFTEPNENNAGSGVRRIEIHVTKDNQEVAVPLDAATFKVKWATAADATPASAQELVIAADDTASTNNLKVFKVDDSTKITTGTLFIYGLKLGETDGKYKVNVDLYDSAMNKTPETAVTLISRDTTKPVINKVKVVGAKARTVYGQAEKTWWMPKEMYEAGNPNKVAFQILANEAGSGLKSIALSKDIEFTAATKLKKGSTYLVAGTDYSLDTTNNIITLLDHYDAKLLNADNESQFEITLENVKLKIVNNAAGNKPAITIQDFVENDPVSNKTGTDDYLVYYDDTTTGTLIFADSTPPQITQLKIKDSTQNHDTNPDAKKLDGDHYTDSQNVTLILTLAAESAHNGSGVEIIRLSDNALFTDVTTIKVDGTLLPSSEYTFASDKKSVTFAKVFIAANVIEFTDVKIASSAQGSQIIKADLTDLTGLDTTASTPSNALILDTVNPVISENGINWSSSDPLVSLGNVQTEKVSDQTLKVDFTEETAGVNVIRLDIDYENGAAYTTPFVDHDFNLTYGNASVAYDISGPYLLLGENKTSGTFNFNNLKLADTAREGQYNIKITLLDAAENKNPQGANDVYTTQIFMDRTAPVVNKVKVEAVKARTVYNDSTHTVTWWMPHDKFDENGNLSKVDFVVNVTEAGTGLKFIELSQNVEFTDSTNLKLGNDYLIKGRDYTLDTASRKITLLNHRQPKLKGTPTVPAVQFTLENVKFKTLDSTDGNQAGLKVTDFVGWDGTNQNANGTYNVYYDDVSTGALIYADSTRPEITELKIEDTAQKSATNPDSLAYDAPHYTDSNTVILTLKLKADAPNITDGSGVKTITLSDNAVFTEATTITVDGTLLPAGNGNNRNYEYTSDKKSVIFKNVFTDANQITFTNVQILSTVDGNQTVKADLTDFVGLTTEASTETSALVLDTVNPSVSHIDWVTSDSGVTTGSEKDVTVDTQALKIDFTEATAGIKVIKFDIHLTGDSSNSFAEPFNVSNFTLKYNGTALVKGTDYTLDTNNRYIILTQPKTTGSFSFENLKLNGTEQAGTYNIDVTLLDAAENKTNTTIAMDIDSTKPVISGELEIPDLIKAYKLTTSGINTTAEYWLPLTYVNGTAKAPDSIPVYITIEENGSGIKVITFANDVTLSTTLTKLFMVASDGTPTEVEASKYTINPTNRTITINQASQALNKNQTNLEFKILVKGIGFANADSSTAFSANKVSVTVSDVAMNTSNSVTKVQGVPAGQSIYSDSRAPEMPSNFKILDRDSSTQDNAPSKVPASENYTNEDIVNMEFGLNASETYGSGYHQFVLSGAKFTTDTAVIMKTTSGNYTIQGIAFELSNENHTLTLKTSDAESKALVIRDAVNVTITNVQLENAANGDKKTVNLYAYDLVGQKHSVPASDFIYFDNEPPRLTSLFAANYSNATSTSCPEYYKPAINVYPHAKLNDETVVGVPVTYGSVENVPTFYTATTYKSGYNTYNGQVSLYSSSLNQSIPYGAVLGVHASDNTQLGGYDSNANTFFHYVQDDNFTKTAAQIINSSTTYRTNPASDINGNTTRQYESLWFGIPVGKYSAVIVDEAGNVSEVFHFAVVKDIEKPTTTNLNDRVLFARPGEDYNVYRNTAAAPSDESAFEHGFKASSSSTSGVNGGGIRTKKFVTKETSDKKYKLILKLGQNYNASNLITNMQGGTVSSSISTSKYADIDGTTSSAPIEQYLISTWYGEWPSSYQSQDSHGYSYAYKPLVPNGTTFPSGQTLDTTSTLSTTNYQDVRNYFGYSADFTSRMRVYDNGSSNPYTSWHSYSHPAGSDGTKYTDYGNSITSYIDSNNNLVIELPPKSTAPVSVFLRDGCGNMTYVVCGLETGKSGSYTWYDEDDTEHETPHNVSYTYQVAPSFIIDNWLGWKQTTNGVNMEPIIRQNPHMLYASSSSNVRWPNWTLTSTTGYAGYKWSYNTGNGDQGGEGEAFGHIKDHVKKATYYNPNISDNRTTVTNSSDNKFKLGLTLYFKQSDEDGSGTDSTVHPEDILFDTSLGKTDSTTDYSTRALLYCTQSSNRPDYDDIVKSHRYDQVSYGDTGFRTDWTAIRISSATTAGVTILLDYPEPDYDTLGWVVNDPVTHEPIPHYMWYVYEDRVGNYEIGKVVNSTETDREVLAGTKASSTVYDKWLFDGKKPTLAIRGSITSTNKTGTSPADIASNQTAVNDLVATNNGYVPYFAGSNNVYVRVTDGGSFRNDDLKNLTTGYGTTHVVEDATNERINEPFMDLEVSEITGIRAFAWSNSSTPPALSHTDMDLSTSKNTHGDNGNWYVGYNAPAQYADIGCPFYYGYNNGNGTSGSGNAKNAYFSFTDSSSSYKGVYSGTKVNTVIPKAMLSDTAAKQLYLHVMDWTGNIGTYKMGESLYFINDTTGPTWVTGQTAYSEDEHYEVTDDLKITIAGNEAGSAARHETMKVRMPTNYFSESGSGFAGFKFGNSTALYVKNVTKDSTGTYIEIPYSEYSTWTGEQVGFWCFDNVGNTYKASITNPNGQTCSFEGVYDTVSPKISTVSFVSEKDKGTEFIHTSTEVILNNNSNYGKYTDFTAKTATTKLTSTTELEAGVTAGKVQEMWVNKLNTSRLHINLNSSITDFNNAVIKKWNGTAWSQVWSWKTNTTDRNTDEATATTFRPNSFTLLNFADTGTYYQIDVSDLAGNHCYQYFKLYLDNQGPTLEIRTGATSTTPTIELGKGSINNISNTYYYTADSSHKATIKFAMKDAGIKNSLQKFSYSFDNSTWTDITDTSDTLTNVTGYAAGGNLDKIYLKDVLGNTRDVDVDFIYSYTNAAGDSGTQTISKLTHWDTTPSAPTISVGDTGNVQTTAAYDNNDWDKTHTKKSDDYDTDKTIIITSQDRRQLKVSFTKPANENIIGYLVTDGSGNVIKNSEYVNSENQHATQSKQQKVLDTDLSAKPNYNVGAYSFVTTLGTEFTEWLPLLVNNGLNEAKEAVTRKYYAVDIVGNISDPLTVVYSYTDANHQATDIRLIKNYNSDNAIQSDAKALIDADIANGTIELAQIVNNNNTWFFSDGFLLLECTLKKKAVSTNNDIPTKVELRDIWGGDWASVAIRGYVSEANNTNGNTVFKVYSSDHTVSGGTSSGRYYCYIAIKVGNDVGSGNNKVWSLDGFYNNDQWGGSQLYAKIFGKSGAESDAISLNPEVAGANNKPRWKRDTTGPVIQSAYLSGSNVKGYTPSSPISIVYDKDSAHSWTGKTNSYSSGLTITIPENGIKDGFVYSGDGGSINYGDFVDYSGVAQYRTLVTGEGGADSGWKNLVATNGNYTIPIPDVTKVHSEIKLYIKDSLGNVSSEYKLGKNDEATSAWWILNNCLTASGTTVTAPDAGWIAGADSTFDIALTEGSIIKSVTAKVGNTNLEVKGITFNGYDGTPTNSDNETIQMSNGWLNLSGLKVTVAPIAQGWDPKSVTITLNDSVSKTAANFVPAKKLSSGDVTLTQAPWSSTGNAETVYDVAITMNGGDNAPSIDKLTGMTLEAYLGETKNDNITVSFDKANSKFTISGSGIPTAKTWANQVIKIKITGANIVDGGIMLPAMTIAPISADDITIKQIITISGGTEQESDLNWASATVNEPTGERTFNLKFHCPTNIPEGTTITTNSVGSISNFDVNNQTAVFKVNKKWDTQSLNISIGDAVKEGLLTVPAIEAADISISSSPDAWASGTTDYTITVGVKGDVTLEASDFSATNATIKSNSWSSTNSTIVINPVTQSWTDNLNVSLTVHGFTKPVFTIPYRKLQSGNIQWGTLPTWSSSATSYEIPVSGMTQLTDDPTKPGRSLLQNSTVTVSIDGVVNSSITGSYVYESNTRKFTISGDALKNQTWSAQTVSINISGDHIDGTITKDIMTITAKTITSSDVTFTPATWASGNTQNTEYIIKLALNGENPPPIATFAAGLTVKQGSTSLTASWVKDDGGAYVLDDGKYQLKLKGFKNITQDWTDKNISVSITGTNINGTITANVLTVPAKVASDYITVTPTNPTAWAENTSSVTFKVASTDSTLNISEVLFGGATVSASNSSYTITAAEGQTIAKTVQITIKAKHNNVTEEVTKYIFPQTGGNGENRFFGRSAALKGMQEVYTFSDTPSSVAALQTRVIELPSVVQRVWDTFAETKEEAATTTLAPASPVAQPKKTSNKAAKKAAKKVEESVAAAAIEVTELPAEALVVPAIEDQVAMLLPKTANEEAVAEPKASVSAGSLEVSVTEAEPAERSNAAIWIILATFCAAIAGLVICLKKKVVKE